MNETKDQETWFNVEVSRSYKKGDVWKDSKTFRRDDLPVVALIVDMAYRWIWRECERNGKTLAALRAVSKPLVERSSTRNKEVKHVN